MQTRDYLVSSIGAVSRKHLAWAEGLLIPLRQLHWIDYGMDLMRHYQFI